MWLWIGGARGSGVCRGRGDTVFGREWSRRCRAGCLLGREVAGAAVRCVRGSARIASRTVVKSCLPGPAGGHPECPLAAGAGQAAGDLEQVAASGAGGLDGPVGRPIRVLQRPRLCARAAITVQALLA